MISLFSLLRSRLLLPVLVTLLLALLAQLLVALLLARVTVGALEKQLAQRLQQDSAALSSALEQAGGEVQTGLQALAGKTQGRLAEGLSTRLGEEQQQLRLLLEGACSSRRTISRSCWRQWLPRRSGITMCRR